MAVLRFDRMPLAGTVLVPTPKFCDVGAVLGVPSVVLDEPKALLRQKAEGLGIVVDGFRVKRGSDSPKLHSLPRPLEYQPPF